MSDDFEKFLELWQAADQFIADPSKKNEDATQKIIDLINNEETTDPTPTQEGHGVRVEWYRPHIIRYIYEKYWTWDDLWRAFHQGKAMMESASPKTVHVFIDMTKSTDILPEAPWEHGNKMDQEAPFNEGMRITIGANSFVKQNFNANHDFIELGNWLKKSHRIKFAATLAEAEHHVAEYESRN